MHDNFLDEVNVGNIILKKTKSKLLTNIINLEINHLKKLITDCLNTYLDNKMSIVDILYFFDAIEEVLDEKYCDEFPETLSPRYSENDERSMGVSCIEFIRAISPMMTKNDAERFIKFLESNDPLKAHQDLRAYLCEKYPQYKKRLM